MKRRLPYVLLITTMLTIFSAIAVFAGTWTHDEKGWKWVRDDGTKAVNCWEWCDGNKDGLAECYCFDKDGYCYLNCTTPDGYSVNADGAWVENNVVKTRKISVGSSLVPGGKSAIQLAKEKANELGNDLKSCYDWCAKGGITYVTDWALDENLGINHYATRGFAGSGDCYDMACCFALMARCLGYDCAVISGQVPLRGGGVSPHCWTEITIDGQRVICDPDFEYERKANGFKINYGQKGTWKYMNYHEMHD